MRMVEQIKEAKNYIESQGILDAQVGIVLGTGLGLSLIHI